MSLNSAMKYFRDNPPLILVLIALVLMFGCAVLLFYNSSFANDVILAAYVMLVTGVLGQLVWAAYAKRLVKPIQK